MEAKKTLIIRIYQALERYSDALHPLTQQQIIDILYRDFGLECERKAVGRNISYLKEMGFDIESDASGTYLASRSFENSELRLLIDSVLSSRHIDPGYSAALIDKLIKLGGLNFKSHVKHVYSVKEWDKTQNKDFFLNIELVDEAIENCKKIAFDYNKTGLNKKLYRTDRHTASPYQLLLHNQHYYLMSHDDKYDKMSFLRLDKITNMAILDAPALPLKENPGYEKGINYRDLATGLPYMYSDKPVLITLKCPDFMMDALCDWFGSGFVTSRAESGYFTATIKASEQAMLFWVLQYNVNVEVLSPSSLRQRVIDALKATLAIYGE